MGIGSFRIPYRDKTELVDRQIKYLNNVFEADHGKLKSLIQLTLGFPSWKRRASRDAR